MPLLESSPQTRRREAPVSGAFRADIQALRALAVVSVLLYHLWPNRVTGGFVGVDVFFVISGYLIMSHLLREREKTGRIALGAFWARRATRLLPASLLVLLLTGLAVIVIVPRTLWQQFLGEIAASTLYVQNWRLLLDSVDYLAAENQASPVQHYWTLSAEEQFYVLLPLVLVAALAVFRRTAWRRVAFLTLAIASAASFGWSIWLMAVAPSEAYFSTFSRAWEFGFGALLAFLPAALGRRTSQVAATIGVGAVLASVVLYSGTATPFPGATALLPVLGTALAIWGGQQAWLDAAGRVQPISMLGRVSYAIYLWHWPLIVLVPFATGMPLTTVHKMAILVASVCLAWLSTTYYEDVLRRSPKLLGRRRPRFIAAWSAVGMACVLAASIGTVAVADRLQAQQRADQEQAVAELGDCAGAAAMLTGVEECAERTDSDIVVPSQLDMLEDTGNAYECYTPAEAMEITRCSLGSQRDDALRVALAGNSHAAMFTEALSAHLEELNWRLDVFVGNGCEWGRQHPVDACGTRIAQTDEALLGGEPYDVLLTTERRSEEFSQATVDQFLASWQRLEARGTQVIVLSDNPGLSEDTTQCILRAQPAALLDGACSFPAEEGYAGPDLQLAAAEASGGAVDLVDLRDLYCVDGICPAAIGNVLVYRDAHHLTATYARSLAPILIERIEGVLAE